MRHPLRYAITAVFVLFLGFLVANKAVTRANAGQHGQMSCSQKAASIHAKSLKVGFSEAAADSQAENTLSRCLIDG